MLKRLFFWFVFSCNVFCNAQFHDSFQQVEFKIQEFSKNDDIISINRLLNTNTYLDPEFTLKVIKDNLEKSTLKGDKESIADTYLTLGNFWFTQGNQAKAFENYLKSEDLARKINNYRIVGLSIMNRSNIPEDLNQKIRMLKEAIEMLKEANDRLNLAKAHLNLGNNYSLFVLDPNDSIALVPKSAIPKYRAEAFRNYEIASDLNADLKNAEINASVNVHYGEWFRFEKEYDKARAAFREAEVFFVHAGRTKGKVYCLHQLALIEKDESNFSAAFELLHEAEEITKKFDYIDYQTETYRQFLELYKLTGEHEMVLKYYDLYHLSVLNLVETNSRDKIYQINLEHKLSENEYLLEKAENKKNVYRIFTLVSLILIALVLGFSFLAIQNKKRKIHAIEQSKIISDIKIKNQELEEELLKEKLKFNQEHLIAFANQVNNIESFLEEMKQQMKKLKTGSVDDINSLKLSFSKILDDQNYIKKLNSLSSELNQEFFMHLRKDYPKITKNDEQLLSFLILDMSSKEIGAVLKISTNSVHTKRYRLRKKLDLNPNETFIDFFNRITASKK